MAKIISKLHAMDIDIDIILGNMAALSMLALFATSLYLAITY